jgi:hypothetical protein
MTSQEELFTRINDNYSSKFIFGDDSILEVNTNIEEEPILCRTDDGEKLQASI